MATGSRRSRTSRRAHVALPAPALSIKAACAVRAATSSTTHAASVASPHQVYSITGVTSVFAYVWLYIILLVWSPDVITIEEGSLGPLDSHKRARRPLSPPRRRRLGIITFAFFWILLLAAYAASKNFFRAVPEPDETPLGAPPHASSDHAFTSTPGHRPGQLRLELLMA